MTHQHFLQRDKIVPISLPIDCFLDTNCVSQPYEFLTDIYSLCKTCALRNESIESSTLSVYSRAGLIGYASGHWANAGNTQDESPVHWLDIRNIVSMWDPVFWNLIGTAWWRKVQWQHQPLVFTYLALNAIIEFDTGPRGIVRVGVAAEFGLKGFPAGTVCQPIKGVQGHFAPLVVC